MEPTANQNNTEFSQQTIIAQCTPSGSGAIALLRLSGQDAFRIADNFSLLASKTKLADVATHTIHYGEIRSTRPKGLASDFAKASTDRQDDRVFELIDKVMFIVMKASKTFTGENVLEITCHNNPFIIEKIISLALANGARLAQPGEFAKRAFLNGKIDLIQAESINDLLGAYTQESLKKSLSNLEGSFSKFIIDIESKLIRSLALCDASFEFLDDEIEFGSQIISEVDSIIKNIQVLKKSFNKNQQIKEGIRIALIGSVNAGKSSLFNTLINKNRAIVSSQAGTTRDSIEAGVYTNDFYITYVDTAGLRQTEDIIEQEGIKRSFEEAAKADIILLVIDASKFLTQQENNIYREIFDKYPNKIILIINKIDQSVKDLSILSDKEPIKISTKNGINISSVHKEINNKIKELFSHNDSPYLLNQRQFNLLLQLETKLLIIKDMLCITIEYELLSIHLNEALQTISELTGKSISEKSMDMIFKEFCVGK